MGITLREIFNGHFGGSDVGLATDSNECSFRRIGLVILDETQGSKKAVFSRFGVSDYSLDTREWRQRVPIAFLLTLSSRLARN